MKVRRTRREELDEAMAIYRRAVVFMAENGNPNQWIDGYPARTLIETDIQRDVSYVVIDGQKIEGVFSYIEGEDPTYRSIVQGAWKSDGPYGTVHRLASAGTSRGVADICFDWCMQQSKAHGCESLRADTHQDNRIMQHLLEKKGFAYCGVIYLESGAWRLAYEYVYHET